MAKAKGLDRRRDLTPVEGALSERLIVQLAERRDYCGYHKVAAVRQRPNARDRTQAKRHDRTDPIEQLPRNPRRRPRALRRVSR
ncbi:hypothetical protein CNECB9_4320002 [Cupriavidus necator]|uniref:Uncharacterized protein n=1 Tax=Cupriavidus necator TaxID=106590 RepID=A0A1K0IKV2_CUPNE|nr:hypothetical protein CNECB9_4320002 [Cupriavidus necator]